MMSILSLDRHGDHQIFVTNLNDILTRQLKAIHLEVGKMATILIN